VRFDLRQPHPGREGARVEGPEQLVDVVGKVLAQRVQLAKGPNAVGPSAGSRRQSQAVAGQGTPGTSMGK